MELDTEALDKLTGDCKTPADLEKIYSKMLQHMINRALEAEMTGHLGNERHARTEDGGRAQANARNGVNRKRVQSAVGALEVELVKKRQVRLAGMEEKILTLYAKGIWCPSGRPGSGMARHLVARGSWS